MSFPKFIFGPQIVPSTISKNTKTNTKSGMSLKRPLVAISFPDKPDCSTKFVANVDNSMPLSFAFAK